MREPLFAFSAKLAVTSTTSVASSLLVAVDAVLVSPLSTSCSFLSRSPLTLRAPTKNSNNKKAAKKNLDET